MNQSIKPFIICAHRGASGTHPENTQAAFEEAIRVGAHMVEFDIRCTADHHLAIIHDSTVDRTTNGTGAVADLTFDYIRSLDAGQGKKVLSLPEAMAYASRVMLNIHANPENKDDALAIAQALVPYFANGDIYDQAFVTAVDQDLLKLLRAADPQIRLCNLLGQRTDSYVQTAVSSHPCEVLQPINAVVTHELVREAHAQGLKVNPFFADDEDEMNRLIGCGVDGILTNHPARLFSFLENRS